MNRRWAWLLLGAAVLSGSACGPRQNKDGPSPSPTTEERPDPDLVGPDLFEDVSARSGIDFAYRNGEDVTPPPRSILETLGGGVALLDYDGDGLLDIYVTGGGYFAGPDNREIRGHPGRLYRNLNGAEFQDVTREAGLDTLAGGQPWFYSHAAAVADYDRDGWPDLLVTGWGRLALFRNVPDGKGGRRFADVSAEAGLDRGVTWATSAAWADLDGDGWPDLYVCQYVDWSFANHPECMYDGEHPEPCTPKLFQGLPHKVFRNLADGRFADVSEEVGLHKGDRKSSKGLGVLIVDVNLDGKPDVVVANDTTDNFLYVNHCAPGRVCLTEEGLLAGVARDDKGSPNGSMGLDAGDPDGSGLPSLWVTNYENEVHALYRNLSAKGPVSFLFCTPAAGIAAIGRHYVGWGTGFVDIDHDGWEDLFIANGHVIRHHPAGAPRSQMPVLLRNRNGKFKELTQRGGAYFRQPHPARGVALGDLDNDGKVDLVVSHVNEPVALLRNVSGDGHHWLGVELVGADHADFVGARVVLDAGGRKQTRFAKGGGSYASSSDRRLVFGLGNADRIAKLTVIWPDGAQQEWTDLSIDRYQVLAQGASAAQEAGVRK